MPSVSTLRKFVDDYRLVRAQEGFAIPDPEMVELIAERVVAPGRSI